MTTPRWMRQGMRSVWVIPRPGPAEAWPSCGLSSQPSGSAPSLTLLADGLEGRYAVVSAAGLTQQAVVPSGGEHFAVDAQLCAEERWLTCADVLHGSNRSPYQEACDWVEGVLARHSGSRLVALPADDGRWVVAERTAGRCDLYSVPRHGLEARALTRFECSLTASCLYGLLAAGHAVRDLWAISFL